MPRIALHAAVPGIVTERVSESIVAMVVAAEDFPVDLAFDRRTSQED
jgi:hypothetical protein